MVHFCGYPYGKKEWKVYELETKEIFVSRNVIVHEHDFTFCAKKNEEKTNLFNGYHREQMMQRPAHTKSWVDLLWVESVLDRQKKQQHP